MARRRVNHDEPGRLVGFIATAVVVGALTGVVAASFKLALNWIVDFRTQMVAQAHGSSLIGFVAVVVASGLAVALAAALVRRIEPHAEGSGIPRVEAVVEGRTEPGSAKILPVKYVGGLLAIGSGLALGREGPSVQMGGNIAIIVSRLGRLSRFDTRILVAAGAAAGLATAFNAPIAGGVFVLEELVKRFDTRTTIATLFASASGFAAAHFLVPGTHEFAMQPVSDPSLWQAPLVLAVGVATGLFGVLYNKAVLAGLKVADTSTWPVELRAGLIGATVGALGWWWPEVIGSGDQLVAAGLNGNGTIVGVALILLVRFALSVVSYAATTPGGLFAPMLVLGTDTGLLIGLVGVALVPQLTPEPAALALIGFAAFFTASVRAPITGLVLATEMTGTVNMLPPMLGACAVAMLIATVARSEPLYDSLTARTVHVSKVNDLAAALHADGLPMRAALQQAEETVTHDELHRRRNRSASLRARRSQWIRVERSKPDPKPPAGPSEPSD